MGSKCRESLIDGDVGQVGGVKVSNRVFLHTEDGFFLFLETGGEVLIESLKIVDASLGVDLLSIGRDEGRSNLLAAEELLVVVLDERALHARHSNGNDYIQSQFLQQDMSDYEYEEQYQYEEEAPEEENVETRVELEYFEIEAHIRECQWERAIEELEALYGTAEEHGLKNYKVKILNQLLQIYSRNSRLDNLRSTITRISQLNTQEKYTENSIRTIVAILRATDYPNIRPDLLAFIALLDPQVRVKSYLMLLEKAIEEKDLKDADALFELVGGSEEEAPPANVLLELYSLQIKYSRLTGSDISEKLHEIELRIPTLEAETYMSEGHISVLKLAIAEGMFLSGNFENSALYVAEAFLEKAKYGNSAELKEILKTNVLISLLIESPALRKDSRYNSLYHDASIPFKNEKEVHELISLIDAYERHDLDQFQRNYASLNFRPESEKYLAVHDRLLFNMKKEKLTIVLKSYRTITFDYIARRLHLTTEQVERMVFELIADERVRARIGQDANSGKFVQMLPDRNEFLEIQAENLKELSKRYLITG